MTVFGKNIRIYLKDGTVTGIRLAEVVNHTIQAISFPRSRALEMAGYPEAKRPGVYFLFGEDVETGRAMVYIGEAENVFDRLQHHIANKDFWNEVIFFVGKDENLTKAHVKYLESRLIQLSTTIDRYKIDNANQSQPASLPMAERDAMEEFLTFIRLLLGVLGHKLLEDVAPQRRMDTTTSTTTTTTTMAPGYQPESQKDNLELFLDVSGIKARALQTDEGIVVLEGSQAAKVPTIALQPGYVALRDSLIRNGVLELIDEKYVFQSNQLFNTPSPAAAIVVGYNINGRQNWRDKAGRSLNEIEQLRLTQTLK